MSKFFAHCSRMYEDEKFPIPGFEELNDTKNSTQKPNVLSSISEDHPRCNGDLTGRITRAQHLELMREAGWKTDLEMNWILEQNWQTIEAGKPRVNSETNDEFILAAKKWGWKNLVKYLDKLMELGPLLWCCTFTPVAPA